MRHLLVLTALAVSLLAWQQPEDSKPPEKKKDEGLILKSDSKVQFTTEVGTWLSLDLSPDGQTLVFDMLGDLYTLPVSGGDARKIIGDMSFESQPRFSPDGSRIVFVSDRSGSENLWTAKPDGTDIKALTKGRGTSMVNFASPSWTPDGQYVMASKSERGIGIHHVFLYHIDGGTGVSLGPPPPTPPAPGSGPPPQTAPNKMGAVASKDGKYVYFAQRNGAFTYNASFPLWQIIRFDRETGETATITNAQGSAFRPLLSPDGKYMVYATRRKQGTSLRVRDLESKEERWLIHNVTRDDQEARATRDVFPGYAFHPDGNSLFVTKDGKIQRVDFLSGQATVIPFRVNVDIDIAPRVYSEYRVDDSPDVTARLIRYPKLSPDGKQVAFTAFNKVYVMDAAGGAPRRLTNGTTGEFQPVWSPDGQQIVYATWTNQGGHLYAVPAAGGTPSQLTRRLALYTQPVFTPDGSKIVFLTAPVDEQLLSNPHEHEFQSPEEAALHGHEGEITGVGSRALYELRWIPSAGGNSIYIAAAQGGRGPHFTSAGDRIYLTTFQGLSSVRLDGLDRRTHIKITGTGAPPNPASASDMKISPDGTRVFAEVQGKHYLVTMPKTGRETVNVSVTGTSAGVPVKKMSAEGGDFLAWSADGKMVTWSWGRKFYRQPIDSTTPQSSEILITQPRSKPSGSVVLRGARIVSMRGDEVIAKGDIVVTGNRIAAIGASGAVAIPAGAKTIDITGKTIVPGLVDAHAHMWPPRDVHQTQVWQYLANLAYGITTTRDPQSSTTDVYAYADLVETGEILGPRIFTTGPGVFSQSGVDDLESTKNYIKRYKEAYQTMTLKQYVAGDRIVRQWVAQACRDNGITPTTEGALDLKLNLTQMIDGFTGHEHSLPIQPLYKDVTEFVAKAKIFYTPTILVAYGAPWTENYWFQNTDAATNEKLRRFVPAEVLDGMVQRRRQWFRPEEYGHKGIAKGVADVVRAGGRAGLGGHGQLQGLGAHWELWSIQSGGLTPHEALRIATMHSAEAIGLQKDVGSLDAGKLADLIVLDKNPLDNIQNSTSARYVMKNGELFDANTLAQVWPAAKELEKPYWWGRE
ncbi:MAG: PD40 domain-containing protein [Bryobacterales bacterium]|nr:PD40 domain-containing protein [Bryobacterales bacterium]